MGTRSSSSAGDGGTSGDPPGGSQSGLGIRGAEDEEDVDLAQGTGAVSAGGRHCQLTSGAIALRLGR
ncbi:hypothetical protein FKM82_029232 [Ascaphus truei]